MNDRFRFMTPPTHPNNMMSGKGNFRRSFSTTPNTSSSPYNNNNYNQMGGAGGQQNRIFNNNSRSFQQLQQQQQQNQNGISLFIKANNVNEELLRSLFSANVSQAKVISIDVKTG
jgi:hypothetical protein